MLWPLALALPLIACRGRFDRVPTDAAIDADPGAHGPVLSCAAPPQFSVNGAASAVAATATAGGYYAFVVDGVGDVHGFSYGFADDQLAARQADVTVFGGATVKGAAATAIPVGDKVLLATLYGQPDALGVALIPRGGDLGVVADPQKQPGWFGLDGTLARAPDGTLAFLGAQSSLDVEAKLVTPTGGDVGAGHVVVDRSEAVNSEVITASDTGFLVTWSASTPSPNEVHAQLLDSALSVTVPATTINTGAMFDGNDPRAAYAAAVDRYLFAWWMKPGPDEVWVSVRDKQLAEITRVRLSVHGWSPRVAAGDDGFLVVWRDDGFPSGLAAARVTFDGAASPLTVAGNGGKTVGWDLVTRAGQPALVWLEGGATSTLWLNPLCN